MNRVKRILFLNGRKYMLDDETELLGSTTALGKLFPKFDADEVLKTMYRGEKYAGKSDEEIKLEWKKIGEEASILGTRMHERIERYYRYDAMEWFDHFPVWENEDLKHEYEKFMKFDKFISNMGFDFFRAEWILFDEKLKIGGMIDAVFYNEAKEEYVVVDWKRCKKVTTKGSYNEKTGLIDCKLERFRVQISLYAHMLRTTCSLKVSAKGYIVNIHPDFSKIFEVELITDVLRLESLFGS